MTPAQRYLDLLAKSVLGLANIEAGLRVFYMQQCLRGKEIFDENVLLNLEEARPDLCESYTDAVQEGRAVDGDLHNLGFAPTMIGSARLQNIAGCLEQIERDGVPGDLIECGVWRGGAALYMRGWLAAHGITHRTVWLADSFAGLPAPSHAADDEDLSTMIFPMLAINQRTVTALFERFDLLDRQVQFIPGWFEESLKESAVAELALLRIDADYFSSTLEALDYLYDRVAPGGFVIVDDFGCIPGCRAAVELFRYNRAIRAPLKSIDWTGVFWRKAE